jgi:hypothetical protein
MECCGCFSEGSTVTAATGSKRHSGKSVLLSRLAFGQRLESSPSGITKATSSRDARRMLGTALRPVPPPIRPALPQV